MPPTNSLKRKRPNQPEEINFDFSARQDYLTGFHKRKVERAKHAQDIAIKKEKQQKLDTRRQLRIERKAELEKYVKSVNDLIAKGEEETWRGGDGSDDSETEWTGVAEEAPVDHEIDYSDEDRNTTVVVEEVDVTRDGFAKPRTAEDDEAEAAAAAAMEEQRRLEKAAAKEKTASGNKKRIWTKDAPKKDKKKQQEKFRYETKVERKMTRAKQKAKGSRAKAARKG